jgi:F-type H+-transporting ATPase subunit epsilon
MTKTFSFKILTAEKTIYQDQVSKVVVPTEAGEIGILPDHAPIVSIISAGEIKISKDHEKIIPLSVDTGILEVRPSSKEKNEKTEVIVLASRSELANEIDIQRAEEAYKRAQKAMEEAENLSDVDFARFQAMIDKELNRIKIARKYRK